MRKQNDKKKSKSGKMCWKENKINEKKREKMEKTSESENENRMLEKEISLERLQEIKI